MLNLPALGRLNEQFTFARWSIIEEVNVEKKEQKNLRLKTKIRSTYKKFNIFKSNAA